MSDQQINPEQDSVELNESDIQPETNTETEQTEQSDRVAELEKQLAAAMQTIAGQKDSVVRAAAEVENVRRRAALDVEKAHKFALERFANELLPVIDNMERALQAADRSQEALAPMIEGIEMTMKSFVDGVAKFGVEMIDPQNQPFNPELHQAMTMQPSEELAPNTVMAVMQKGYQLNGRLLRPAMVIVSKAP